MPWPTPVGIGAFVSTGDWRAIIVAIISVLAAGAVYYPFIMRYDARLKQEEIDNSKLLNAEDSEADLDEFFSLN